MKVKRSIALVIAESATDGPAAPGGGSNVGPDRPRWLLVRRPGDDPDLPGVWGLPAGSRGEGESREALIRRIGREKLGVELGPLGALVEGGADRTAYRLKMQLHGAVILEGTPAVPQSASEVTQYSEWAWKHPQELADGAGRGSLCCRLGLDLGVSLLGMGDGQP